MANVYRAWKTNPPASSVTVTARVARPATAAIARNFHRANGTILISADPMRMIAATYPKNQR